MWVTGRCDLLRSNFPEDFYFSVRVPLCTNVVDKQALRLSYYCELLLQ